MPPPAAPKETPLPHPEGNNSSSPQPLPCPPKRQWRGEQRKAVAEVQAICCPKVETSKSQHAGSRQSSVHYLSSTEKKVFQSTTVKLLVTRAILNQLAQRAPICQQVADQYVSSLVDPRQLRADGSWILSAVTDLT